MSRLLFGVPTVVGGVIAGGIAIFLGWPQWQQVEVGRSRAAELRGLEAQLPLMAKQLKREQKGMELARDQQGLVLQLIAGSGSLATFLSQLDRLAAGTGVELALYEPQTAAPPVAEQKSGTSNSRKVAGSDNPEPIADPLLSAGLEKQEQLVSAKGSYPALLAWMRQLEKLNVLVVQSNLLLESQEKQAQPTTSTVRPAIQPVQLKMSVATYSRSTH